MNASGVKGRVPWPAKIAAKVVLARLPVSYRAWSKLGLFRHGSMDEPDYAIGVVRTHLERAGVAIGSPFRALELGPGDSVASAIVACAFGATETYLVDVGRFAAIPVEDYLPLVDALAAQGYAVPDLRGAASIDELCERVGAHYLVDGVASLRAIASASVDIEWSQAVLEHVRVDQFDEIQRELRRVLRPSGVASHRVDLQDHLNLSLNNLRFSDRVWERPAVWNSGFYTNRLRCAEIIASMTRAGYDAEVVDHDRWPDLPVKRAKLAARFRDLPADELLIRWFDVVARPS
ncbi:MAG: hypothetical protein QOI95_3133 [Acidimicrobiaceae bacterium]|jgi:SAM-dependent methyltransferase